jgi:hypothetical protein
MSKHELFERCIFKYLRLYLKTLNKPYKNISTSVCRHNLMNEGGSFWVLFPGSLIEVYQHCRSACCLWNVGELLPDYLEQLHNNFITSTVRTWNLTNLEKLWTFSFLMGFLPHATEADSIPKWFKWLNQ